MKELIYKIDGINYLLFEYSLTSKSELQSTTSTVESYKGIIQSFKSVEGGFWDANRIDIAVLIPENNALAFSNHSSD